MQDFEIDELHVRRRIREYFRARIMKTRRPFLEVVDVTLGELNQLSPDSRVQRIIHAMLNQRALWPTELRLPRGVVEEIRECPRDPAVPNNRIGWAGLLSASSGTPSLDLSEGPSCQLSSQDSLQEDEEVQGITQGGAVGTAAPLLHLEARAQDDSDFVNSSGDSPATKEWLRTQELQLRRWILGGSPETAQAAQDQYEKSFQSDKQDDSQRNKISTPVGRVEQMSERWLLSLQDEEIDELSVRESIMSFFRVRARRTRRPLLEMVDQVVQELNTLAPESRVQRVIGTMLDQRLLTLARLDLPSDVLNEIVTASRPLQGEASSDSGSLALPREGLTMGDLMTRVEDLTEQLQESEERCIRAQEEFNQTLKQTIRNYETEKRDLTAERDALRSEGENVRESHSNLSREHEALQEELGQEKIRAQKLFDSMWEEIAAKQQAREEFWTGETTRLQQERDVGQHKILELEHAVLELQDRIIRVREQSRAQALGDCAKIKAQAEEGRRRLVVNLQGQMDAAIQESMDAVEVLQTQNRCLRESLQEQGEHLQIAREDVATVNAEVTTLQQQLLEAREALERAQFSTEASQVSDLAVVSLSMAGDGECSPPPGYEEGGGSGQL
jgi:hypothetical protein